MTDGRGLTGSVRGMASCALQIPGRCVGIAGRRPRLGPRDLTARPGASELDRLSGTAVPWSLPLEEVEHVLGAVGSPGAEKAVVIVSQAAAPTNRDEAWVADLWEDH
jgi:hypothetical protein